MSLHLRQASSLVFRQASLVRPHPSLSTGSIVHNLLRNASAASSSPALGSARSFSLFACRQATSRSASTISKAAPIPNSCSPTGVNAANELTWNDFLSLRKIRRRYSLVSSIVFALSSSAAGLIFAAANDVETTIANQFGLDPMFVFGLITVTFGTIGWLAGPALGHALFGLVHRSQLSRIAQKEKAFFARIKKYRVDPSASSPQNPVPDYYGEKIGSVADYRRWLKDQRAYRLKMSRSII